MEKYFLIMRSNLRKARAQTIPIAALMLVASLMMNLWLMLSMDYKPNFDKSHDRLNSEHITVSVSDHDDEVRSYLTQLLNDDDDVADYRMDDCLHMTGSLPYNGGDISSWFVILDKETATTRSVGRSEIVEQGDPVSGVYLPMLYKSEEIKVGNSITLSLKNIEKTYTVCGFFNNTMMGSHNCYMMEIILTDDQYEKLEEDKCAMPATLCSVRLNDKSKNDSYASKLKNTLSEKFPNNVMVSNNYDMVKQSRYISQMVCSGIISAVAFLILLIALVVISSNISNYIQENIQNLGAFKAIGYTGTQLITSLIVQFVSICLVFAVIGTGLSYLVFPALNDMMISQTGIPYEPHFLPVPALLSVLIPSFLVTLVTWLSARKIRRIEPIVALRQGIETHNFRKNHVPLDKADLPVNLALALKTTVSNLKQNITITITMLVLSLTIAFCGLMFKNVILDNDAFLALIAGEMTDSCITIEASEKEEFLDLTEEEPDVEKVYLYTTQPVNHTGHSELYANISDDFSKVNNQSVCYKGRFPKHDNEIALAAKYAKDMGFEIGDEISLTVNGTEEKYIITGLTQLANNFGKDCLLTLKGYEQLAGMDYLSYYVDLKDDVDIQEFNDSIVTKMNIFNTVDVDKVISSGSAIYTSLMTIIVIVIILLSVLIITFVLFFLVRTLISSKKHDYGIMKSLGYTSTQLIIQTALSFMPTMILSTVIGLTLSCFVINPLTAVFLSGIGIVKCTFGIPYGFIIVTGIGLIVVSFLIACLLSLRIKKITPGELLSGE